MSSSYALSSWMFARALALIYCIAFCSVAVQASGLWGSRGISPIKEYLGAVEKQVGEAASAWYVPSVFWLGAGDNSITSTAWIGAGAAALALVGFAQGWMFLVCFVLYLSFVTTGQDFLSFQWDALLLEVGFLALFAVPWSFSFQLGVAADPHWSVRFMFYVVLFKLMFLSGVVKLASGDPLWRDLSALSVHYWTQPLPNPLSPFIHSLPDIFHRISTVLTFVVELLLPFFIFRSRTRWFAATGFIALSLLIFVSGNYTFFNLLTLALAFWLIPNSTWERVMDWLPVTVQTVPTPLFAPPVTAGLMAVLAMVSLVWCTRWFYPDVLNTVVDPVLNVVQRFHISSSYGLFANMTDSRPEIVLEGSMDGQTWKEYEFKYKAGNLYRQPPVVAPYQPRLDWQMWFAALGSFRTTYWFQNLMLRIFEGSGEVLALLDSNPFPDGPPKYLRARLYEYTFTDPSTIVDEGKWWERKFLREYSPMFENPR